METRSVGAVAPPCSSLGNAVRTHLATRGQHPPSSFKDQLSQKQHFLLLRGKRLNVRLNGGLLDSGLAALLQDFIYIHPAPGSP